MGHVMSSNIYRKKSPLPPLPLTSVKKTPCHLVILLTYLVPLPSGWNPFLLPTSTCPCVQQNKKYVSGGPLENLDRNLLIYFSERPVY